MRNEYKFDINVAIVLFVSLAYAAIFSYFMIMKYYNFDATCVHNGMGIRMAKEFFKGSFLSPYYFDTIRSIKYFIILYPLSALLAPFFAVFAYPELLLIFQAALIGLGCLPLYLLSRQYLNSRALALSLAASYFLYPPINIISLQGFKYPSIAIPLLFYLFYFLSVKDARRSIIFLVLVNLVVINAVFMTVVLGLVFWMFYKEPLGRTIFKISSIWLLAALCIFALMFLLGRDTFPTAYVHLDNYGSGLLGALKALAGSGPVIIERVANNAKSLLPMICLPPGVFMVFGLSVLAPAAAELFYSLIAPCKISTIVLILPFIFFAVVCGLRICRHTLSVLLNKIFKNVDIMFVNISLGLVIIVPSLICHYFYKPADVEPLYLSKYFDVIKYYALTDHAKAGLGIIKTLPKNSAVLASRPITNHLYEYAKIGDFPYDLDKARWDYIFVDIKNPVSRLDAQLNTKSYQLYIDALKNLLKKGSGYGVIVCKDGFLVLKQGFSQNKNLQTLVDITPKEGN